MSMKSLSKEATRSSTSPQSMLAVSHRHDAKTHQLQCIHIHLPNTQLSMPSHGHFSFCTVLKKTLVNLCFTHKATSRKQNFSIRTKTEKGMARCGCGEFGGVSPLHPPRLRSPFFRTQTNSLFSTRTQTLVWVVSTQARVWKIYLLVLEVLGYGEGGEVKWIWKYMDK